LRVKTGAKDRAEFQLHRRPPERACVVSLGRRSAGTLPWRLSLAVAA